MSDTSQGPGWYQASDGKWYPPQPAAPPPAPVKAKGGCFRWIGIAVVAIIVLIVIAAIAGGGGDDDTATTGGGGDSEQSSDPDADKTDDVTIDSCERDDALGFATAKLTVVNNSSKESNYIISIGFEDAAGTKIGEGTAAVNNVAAGQTAKTDAVGTTAVEGGFTCKVADVTRYASG